MSFKAYAAEKAGGELKPIEYDPGAIKKTDVEIKVEYCGICHSDLSMLNNDWQMTGYPFVPGHEVVGIVDDIGDHVTTVAVGDRVGVGWFSKSCMTCESCMKGDHNLCATAEGIMVGRYGGFADRVRIDQSWAVRLPDAIDPKVAGPLFCGGITVFNPIVQNNIKPTDRVGVVGIGGLGHMALKFLNAWGCEVTAFSSSPEKSDEALTLGAHHVVNSRDSEALEKITGSLDFILSTVNVNLDWASYLNILRPKGKLHIVGVVPEPIPIPVFPMILGQKSISGSPLGSPATIKQMLDFTVRHKLDPVVEEFPMNRVNDAMEILHSGKPRYRLVLKA